MFGKEDESWNTEWKYWLNKLAMLWSVLGVKDSRFMTEGMLSDFAMDFKYLNILLLFVDV